jgi:hypothetical protein
MDNSTALSILNRVKEAQTKQASQPFVQAVQGMAGQQLKSDALGDVGNLALATLGLGAGARGAVGLYNLLRNRPVNTRSGPAELPLPIPVAAPPAEEEEEKLAGFLSGDAASTKGGLPWYGPAMMLAGMTGLGAGWKGVDMLLDSRRQKQREEELNKARSDFNNALLAQYDQPVTGLGTLKAASDDAQTMQKVAEELDVLYDQFAAAFTKQADLGNIAGMATGGYGMYAGLSGLLAGAMVFDKIRKRSRANVVNKALQRRERRTFQQQPPEVYAVPEPVEMAAPDMDLKLAQDNFYLWATKQPLSHVA